ncbi:hypothetical protein C8J40_105353 [Sphingomonas sp. PP-CC-3A-396]|nr:hypothetical protein C8J40_105353 [Sphingomonas sp. PP-CC-3A-396]
MLFADDRNPADDLIQLLPGIKARGNTIASFMQEPFGL